MTEKSPRIVRNPNVLYLVLSGLFLALGIVLPQAFHVFGPQASRMFSPMHLPVLLCGFFLPWPYALAVGALTPALSSLFTGMPPLPVLRAMIPELAAYAVCVSLFRRWTPDWAALLLAMVAGRLVSTGVTGLLAVLGVAEPTALLPYFFNLFANMVPAIILHITVSLAVVYGLKMAGFKPLQRKHAKV